MLPSFLLYQVKQTILFITPVQEQEHRDFSPAGTHGDFLGEAMNAKNTQVGRAALLVKNTKLLSPILKKAKAKQQKQEES